MSTVNVELASELVRALRLPATEGDARWPEGVAPGMTLRHLLERLVSERPELAGLYDPVARRVADQVHIAINGRRYELFGGLTYLLRDGDSIRFASAAAEEREDRRSNDRFADAKVRAAEEDHHA